MYENVKTLKSKKQKTVESKSTADEKKPKIQIQKYHMYK